MSFVIVNSRQTGASLYLLAYWREFVTRARILPDCVRIFLTDTIRDKSIVTSNQLRRKHLRCLCCGPSYKTASEENQGKNL